MNKWFYRCADQVVGPFEREVLPQLKAAGVIDDSTLVKSVAEGTWRAFGEWATGTEDTHQRPNDTSPRLRSEKFGAVH